MAPTISASREAILALACVIIVNLSLFLTFDARNLSQVLLQVGSIVLWYVLSKVTVLHPIYSKVSKFWYQLRIYIRICLILIGMYYMNQNRIVRLLLSGFFSFKGIAYFARHRIRVRLVSDHPEEIRKVKTGKSQATRQ